MYINMDNNNEVISSLKFIGKINKDEKINIRYMFVQSDDIATRISRTFYNKDNRGNTLNFIRTTIDRSFDIISVYMTTKKEFELTICKHIIKDLKIAKNGIINLKSTYLTDVKFCCDMDTIIQNIDAKLESVSNEFNEACVDLNCSDDCVTECTIDKKIDKKLDKKTDTKIKNTLVSSN